MISLKVISTGEYLELFPDTRVRMVFNNPWFGDSVTQGDYSYPFDLPATGDNRRRMGFLDLIENVSFSKEIEVALLDDNVQVLTGTLVVKYASSTRYKTYLSVKLGAVASRLKDLNLSDTDLGGNRRITTVDTPTDWPDPPLYPDEMQAHMNEVAEGTSDDYDYAFFPLLNEDFYVNVNNDSFYSHYVNYWSSVANGRSFLIDNDTNGIAPDKYTITPFPYLKYVLTRIFADAGIRAGGEFLDDAEIAQLTIYNNRSLDRPTWPTYENDYVDSINLVNHVPDITQEELLQVIKKTFRVGYFFNSSGSEVSLISARAALDSQEYDDWSNKVARDYEISQDDIKGYTLSFSFDPDDELTESYPKDLPEDVIIGGSFNNINELESAILTVNQTGYYYYLLTSNQWWVYDDNDDPFFAAEALVDKVLGDGKNTIDFGCAPVFMYDGPDYWSNWLYNNVSHTYLNREWLVPTVKQSGNSQWKDVGLDNPFTLRLLFYRGLQPDSLDSAYAGDQLYPLGTSYNYDYHGNRIGNYSLSLEGDYGLYKVWQKPWLDIMQSSRPATTYAALNIVDILNLSMWKKTLVGSTMFIKKTVEVTFPLADHLAKLELVRIPGT